MNESSNIESLNYFCDQEEKFRGEMVFIWQFAPASGDMYELSTNAQEKKHYANIVKTWLKKKKAMKRTLKNGHCPLWYVVLCGCVSEFEGLQNKIKYRQYFKEHLDKTREDTGTLSQN